MSNKYGVKRIIEPLNRTLNDIIDEELIKGPDNQQIDERIYNVAKDSYENELYELFRLELSNFLYNHEDYKKRIESIIENKKLNKLEKKQNIKKILYKYTNKELNKLFSSIYNIDEKQEGGQLDEVDDVNDVEDVKDNNQSEEYDEKKIEEAEREERYRELKNKKEIIPDDKIQTTFVNLIPEDPKREKIVKYKISNNRNLCKIHMDKKKCNEDINCDYGGGKCKLALTKKKLVLFINKVSDELVSNELKSNEILQKDNYFVSDIVNPDRFKERPNQKIIKSANLNIQKILGEIFGKNNIPQIGKNRPNRNVNIPVAENITYPLEQFNNKYIQLINQSNGIFRAYANCFYWLKHKYSDITFRNLGHYSPFQTDMSNIFKSFIIDYLLSKKRTNKMVRDFTNIIKLNDDSIQQYLEYFTKSIIPKYLGLIDLYILNQLHYIPIIIYDIYERPFVIIDNGFKYINFNNDAIVGNDSIIDKYLNENKSYINIKYSVLKPSLNSSIANIYSLYFV